MLCIHLLNSLFRPLHFLYPSSLLLISVLFTPCIRPLYSLYIRPLYSLYPSSLLLVSVLSTPCIRPLYSLYPTSLLLIFVLFTPYIPLSTPYIRPLYSLYPPFYPVYPPSLLRILQGWQVPGE